VFSVAVEKNVECGGSVDFDQFTFEDLDAPAVSVNPRSGRDGR